jgi:hypothetical protein
MLGTGKEEVMVIGYQKAKNLMVQLDWKMAVTVKGEDIISITLYYPKQPNKYTVRRDSGKKLMKECWVCGHLNMETAVMCYDHEGSNPDLI